MHLEEIYCLKVYFMYYSYYTLGRLCDLVRFGVCVNSVTGNLGCTQGGEVIAGENKTSARPSEVAEMWAE